MASSYSSAVVPANTPIGTLDTGGGSATNTLAGVCYRIRSALRHSHEEVQRSNERLANLRQDLAICQDTTGDKFRIELEGQRQDEIEKQLDLTKNQAPSQIEAADEGEKNAEVERPKIAEATQKPKRRVAVKV